MTDTVRNDFMEFFLGNKITCNTSHHHQPLRYPLSMMESFFRTFRDFSKIESFHHSMVEKIINQPNRANRVKLQRRRREILYCTSTQARQRRVGQRAAP